MKTTTGCNDCVHGCKRDSGWCPNHTTRGEARRIAARMDEARRLGKVERTGKENQQAASRRVAYTQGYNDGKADAVVHCGECRKYGDSLQCPMYPYAQDVIRDHCCKGERKDGERMDAKEGAE